MQLEIKKRGGKSVAIFIHGVMGSPKSTWGQFPDFITAEPHFGFLDVGSFRYATRLFFERKTLDNIARVLKASLEQECKGYDDVYILAHSLGGLITKRTLVLLANDESGESKKLRDKLRKVYFFAVPHAGSWVATVLSRIWPLSRHSYVALLKTNSSPIDALRTVLPDCLTKFRDIDFKIIYGTRDWVVRESAMALGEASYLMAVDNDHNLVSPKSAGDLIVRLVVNEMEQQWVRSIECAYLRRMLELYGNTEISRSYIEPTCSSYTSIALMPVFDTVLASLRRPRARVLLVGDYGAGKTSFAYYLAKRLAEGNLEHGSQATLPLFIGLAFASRTKDLVLSVQQYVLRWGITFPEDTLRRIIANCAELDREIVFILDGFDEWVRRFDWSEVPACIRALDDLQVQDHRIKVLLTCRTTFFRDEMEPETLNPTTILRLNKFTIDQVSEFVQKALPENAMHVLSTLDENKPLKELCASPFHLFMLCQSVKNQLDSGESEATMVRAPAKELVDAEGLYDRFVSTTLAKPEHIQPDWSLAQQREFLAKFALERFAGLDPEFRLQQIETALAVERPQLKSLTEHSMRLANCGLFMLAGSRYRFLHPSLVEYLAAEHAMNELYNGNLEPLGRRPMYVEVFEHIANRLRKSGLEKIPKDNVLSSENAMAHTNLLAAFTRWKNPDLLPWYVRLSQTHDSDLVRLVALTGLGYLQLEESIKPLQLLIENEKNTVVRRVAQRILQKLTRELGTQSVLHDSQSLPEVRPVLPKDAERVLNESGGTNDVQGARVQHAFRRVIELGDRMWAGVITAFYLLAAVEDREHASKMESIAERSTIAEVKETLHEVRSLFPQTFT